jgi:hypothetical protein
MIKINIYALFSPDIRMYKCDSFTTVLTVFNYVVFVAVILGFFFSRKRLAMPFILFQFAQNIYFMSLTNALKDDCLANIFASFDSFAFSRLAQYFVGSVASENTKSFLSLYAQYDFLLYNMLDIIFYVTIFAAIFVVLANAYVSAVAFGRFVGGARRSLKEILVLFQFSIPLKFIEVAYYPLCFMLIGALFNTANVNAANIIVFILATILCVIYLFFSNTILTTYFSLYLRSDFLNRFGGLYSHLNFVNLRTIGRMVRQTGTEDYMLYRYVNMMRGHLTFAKIVGFFQAVLIVYTQNTDGFSTYVVLMIIQVLESSLFIFLKIKNENYFYTAFVDHFMIWMRIVLVVTQLILLVTSRNTSSLQFACVFLAVINLAFYLTVIAAIIAELIMDQSNDILWKIRHSKREKTSQKAEFVKLLQAEVVDLDGRTVERKVVRRLVAAKTGDTGALSKSEFNASKPNPETYGFVLNKYN